MGACEQCIQNNCYSTGCNANCIQHGDTCYTEWMGGGELPLPESLKYEARKMLDHATYIQAFVVTKPTKLMAQAGISDGSLITHVNGNYPENGKAFAELVAAMPKGTVITVFDLKSFTFEDITL